jgi:hypothetical protein
MQARRAHPRPSRWSPRPSAQMASCSSPYVSSVAGWWCMSITAVRSPCSVASVSHSSGTCAARSPPHERMQHVDLHRSAVVSTSPNSLRRAVELVCRLPAFVPTRVDCWSTTKAAAPPQLQGRSTTTLSTMPTSHGTRQRAEGKSSRREPRTKPLCGQREHPRSCEYDAAPVRGHHAKPYGQPPVSRHIMHGRAGWHVPWKMEASRCEERAPRAPPRSGPTPAPSSALFFASHDGFHHEAPTAQPTRAACKGAHHRVPPLRIPPHSWVPR